MNERTLYYQLDSNLLVYHYSDKFIKLLGLRGFEYTISNFCVFVHSDDFDIDLFVEILDVLRFDCFYAWDKKKILEWDSISKEEFVSELLANWPS